MHCSMRLATFFTVLATASLISAAAHAGSWVSLLNCTGKKLDICVFDTSDVIKKFEAASGSLYPCNGGSSCADNTRTSYGCSSNNGCKVNITGGGACIKADTFISRSLHQHAWKIVSNGSGGYDYIQVNPDWKWFDAASHRTCK